MKLIKPIIILPPGLMAKDQIQMLRDNDLCVVIAKDPAKVRFMDSISAISSRTQMENAAIQLSRKLMAGIHPDPGQAWTKEARKDFARLYLDILLKGSPLDPEENPEERATRIHLYEKDAEIRRLAIQEAREERAAKKAAMEKQKTAATK